MRSFANGLLIAAFSLSSGAQAEPRTEPETQDITRAELQGKTISVVLNLETRIRSNAKVIVTREVTRRIRLQIGENGAVTVHYARETYIPGQVNVLKYQFGGIIGQPGKNSIGHDILLLLEKNNLSSFAVEDVGAVSLVITFSRRPFGLDCTSQVAPFQEIGAGSRKTVGPTKIKKVEVVGIKVLSSACNVQATDLVKDNDGFWATRSKPKVPANCTRCLSRCVQCGAPEGSRCFQACRANANPYVRSYSACGKGGFLPC